MRARRGEITDSWLYKGLKSVQSSPELIKARVAEARRICRESPSKDSLKDRTALLLVERRSRPATAIGVMTGALGLIPLVGQTGAVAVALTAEIISVSQQEMELCLSLAHNYGHDIAEENPRALEMLAILGREMVIGDPRTASKLGAAKALDKVVARYARLGLLWSFARVLTRIETRRLGVSLSKAIPVLGMGLGGLCNYLVLQRTGLLAMNYYKGKKR